MSQLVAKVAVSAATYWIDKPYDYLVPDEMHDKISVGMRVYVPFSRGNRKTEGIVLSLDAKSEYSSLKAILMLLDEEAVLNSEQLKLAYFLRDRFFCTVYEAVKCILPAGLWFNDQGRKKVNDKTVEMARLSISAEDAVVLAEKKRRRSPAQAEILDMLCSFEALPSRDLMAHCGASRTSLKSLCTSGAVQLYRREVFRRPQLAPDCLQPLPQLSEEQRHVFEGLDELACSEGACAALLQGITGSGKTSVYIHLIASQLRVGKSAILLVPEIALTPQMLATFSSHFGDEIAVLHSSLSPGERYDEWKRLKTGRAHVAIGTRSAVFAPVSELGLIIIDEEQEESYKSENSPRYNTRDVAKFRCAKSGAMLLMGSATPDIVSRYNAETGRYSFFRLDRRYNEMQLPQVKIVDMKRELRRGNSGNISSFLRDELQANIDREEQSILFLNRRGTNKLISCSACGYTFKCPRCSVSLSYHSINKRLMCHYCGYSRPEAKLCPECEGSLIYVGAGTQSVVEELGELFPDIEIMRMDTDSVAPVGSHQELFERFSREKIPIMVGTQMVTKGLNFENVTLVGVISADQSLYSGSYKSAERTFSLITQVVGRSGRGAKPGRAVIQSYTPENETILQAAAQNYDDFYASELEMRKLHDLPPFMDIFTVTASGQDEELVQAASAYIRSFFDIKLGGRDDCLVFGPTPPQIVKVNNRYRYKVNINCKNTREIRQLIFRIIVECSTDKRFKGVSFFADYDPLD